MKNKDEDAELWAYDEPHESGGNCHVTMTKAQAIAWMKSIWAKRVPNVMGCDGASNEDLFRGWVAVHWAYKVGLIHSPRCGVDFRGCAPDCPKDRAEQNENERNINDQNQTTND